LEAAYTDVVTTDLPEWNRTPNCSTSSPASNQPALNYAQRSTAAVLLTSGNGPALHITQRCS